MASFIVPWDRRPEYIAFTDLTPIPGITSYVGPRGGTGTNRTSFHPGQAFLSEYNLPDIMYQLHPCEEWKRFKKSPLPKPKTNPDGSLVYEQWTRPGDERKPLLDFKLLPDKISSEEGWWYHEFVRRMDPRIRQRDLIMREEASAERSRMNDQRYINLHLNTPGYRTYRPAWSMLAWQVTASAEQNDREQFVLERLTDAQKSANTTRGSTPGLINPALGEMAGNRVALPDLVRDKRGPRPPKANTIQTPATQPVQPEQNKRGPRRRRASANNDPATQPVQPAQVPQPAQAPQAPPTSHSYQTQQISESPQGSRFWGVTAAFPVAPTAIGVPFEDPGSVAAIPGQNDLRPYTQAQARDRAAMPPPPLPSAPRNSQLPPARVSGLHPDQQHSTNRLQEIDDSQAHTMGVNDSGTMNDHGHELEYPFMSDEDIAIMSAKSDEAMAEIHRICEPLLGPCSTIEDPPPMALSPALIEELGLGFLFPLQADGELQGNWNEDKMPTPAQTMQAGNVAQRPPPVLSGKQGTKRKEYDIDGNEYFQDVQLDVEKQARRSRKQVKSVHHATLQNNNQAQYHDTNYIYHPQQHYTPLTGASGVEYSHGKAFGGPALQVAPPARPPWFASVEDADPYEEQSRTMIGQNFSQINRPFNPKQYTTRPLGAEFPTLQPSVGPAYIPPPAPAAPPSGFQPLGFLLSGPTGTSSQDNMQASQKRRRRAPLSSSVPIEQPQSHQPTATLQRPRVDRGHGREPLGNMGNSHRYHPYANPGRGNAQSIEASQAQQLDDENQYQPIWTTATSADYQYIPEQPFSPLAHTQPPTRIPKFPLDPYLDNVSRHRDSDPRARPRY